MKYCPKCRGEFEDYVKICPDCNEPLIDNKPEEEEWNWEDLKVVYTTDNPQIAEMIKIELENAGIKVFVENENFATMMPLPAVGDIEIAVKPEDEEKARRI